MIDSTTVALDLSKLQPRLIVNEKWFEYDEIFFRFIDTTNTANTADTADTADTSDSTISVDVIYCDKYTEEETNILIKEITAHILNFKGIDND